MKTIQLKINDSNYHVECNNDHKEIPIIILLGVQYTRCLGITKHFHTLYPYACLPILIDVDQSSPCSLLLGIYRYTLCGRNPWILGIDFPTFSLPPPPPPPSYTVVKLAVLDQQWRLRMAITTMVGHVMIRLVACKISIHCSHSLVPLDFACHKTNTKAN